MHSRFTVSALVVATMAVTPTVPAYAADGITDSAVGTYVLEWKQGVPDAKWVFAPCEDGAPRCVTVSQFALTDTQFKKPQFVVGNAYWLVGSWTAVGDVKNLIKCKDSGEKFTYPQTWSWDAATGVGYSSYIDPGFCGDEGKGKVVTGKFNLTKVNSDVPTSTSSPAPPPAAPPAPAAPATPPPAPAEPAAAAAPAATPAPAPGAAESSAPPPAA